MSINIIRIAAVMLNEKKQCYLDCLEGMYCIPFLNVVEVAPIEHLIGLVVSQVGGVATTRPDLLDTVLDANTITVYYLVYIKNTRETEVNNFFDLRFLPEGLSVCERKICNRVNHALIRNVGE